MQQLKFKIQSVGGKSPRFCTQHHEMSWLNFSSLGDLHPRQKWVEHGTWVSHGNLYIPDELKKTSIASEQQTSTVEPSPVTSKLLPTEKPCGFHQWTPRGVANSKALSSSGGCSLKRAGTTGKSPYQKKGCNVHGDCSPLRNDMIHYWFRFSGITICSMFLDRNSFAASTTNEEFTENLV